jgi:hypothetical protein
MPPLALHTAVAKSIGEQLQHRTLEAELGSLYLGSTAPDICILTRWERECTHFFDLRNYNEQDGVSAMLKAYPALARPVKLSPASAAFVAGFITHLVMDEIWITDVYRPFFGKLSPMGGSERANIMDKAMQYELDRQSRDDRDAVAHIVKELARTSLDIEVGFIDKDTIRRWRDLTMEAVNHPADWKRFRYVGGRALKAIGVDSAEAYREFLKTLPDLLNETTSYLTHERIQSFMEDSVSRGVEALKEYLD